MPGNLTTRQRADLLILRQNANPPSDEEWDACLDLVRQRAHRLDRLKTLVVTAGGTPSANQRKRLQALIQGYKVPIAVVSDSMAVRFVASSVAMLTPRIQSFEASQLDRAYDHLELSVDERSTATGLLDAMAAEIA
ncbi:MAG: hypothetical protein ACOCXM_10280 [Myxococcota bacterium]